jgi:L-threonylcarbamoyladenylate synthase
MIPTFPDKKIGVLAFQKHFRHPAIAHQEVLSPSGDVEEAARNLYSAMHRLDQMELDVILAERMPDEGLGKVINDKLERASQQ